MDRPGCRCIRWQPSTAHVAMLVESGVGGRPGPGQSASPATSHWNGIGHRGSEVGRTCSPLVFRGSPLAGLMSCSAAPVKINPSPNSHSPPASYHPLHQRSLDCLCLAPAQCLLLGQLHGMWLSLRSVYFYHPRRGQRRSVFLFQVWWDQCGRRSGHSWFFGEGGGLPLWVGTRPAGLSWPITAAPQGSLPRACPQMAVTPSPLLPQPEDPLPLS